MTEFCMAQMTVISNTPEATTNDQKVCLKWIDYPQTLVCNIKVQSVLDNKVGLEMQLHL